VISTSKLDAVAGAGWVSLTTGLGAAGAGVGCAGLATGGGVAGAAGAAGAGAAVSVGAAAGVSTGASVLAVSSDMYVPIAMRKGKEKCVAWSCHTIIKGNEKRGHKGPTADAVGR